MLLIFHCPKKNPDMKNSPQAKAKQYMNIFTVKQNKIVYIDNLFTILYFLLKRLIIQIVMEGTEL